MVEVAVDMLPHHLSTVPRSSHYRPSLSPLGCGTTVQWFRTEAESVQPRTTDRIEQRLEQAGVQVGAFIGRWVLRRLNVLVRRQDTSENRLRVPVSGFDRREAASRDRVSRARRQANAGPPQPIVQGIGIGPAVTRCEHWTPGMGQALLDHETLLIRAQSQRGAGDLVVLAAARSPESPRREPPTTTERYSSIQDIGVRSARWLTDLMRSTEGWPSVLAIVELAEKVPLFQAGLRRLLGPSGAALLPLGTTLIGLVLSTKTSPPGATVGWPLCALLARYALGGLITPPLLDLLLVLIGVAAFRWATHHQPLRFALLPYRAQPLRR